LSGKGKQPAFDSRPASIASYYGSELSPQYSPYTQGPYAATPLAPTVRPQTFYQQRNAPISGFDFIDRAEKADLNRRQSTFQRMASVTRQHVAQPVADATRRAWNARVPLPQSVATLAVVLASAAFCCSLVTLVLASVNTHRIALNNELLYGQQANQTARVNAIVNAVLAGLAQR
jgi:hypothetical protein